MKFFCPIELTRPNVPEASRFFFIEVEATCPMHAMMQQRDQAIQMLGGTGGYARWAPQRELPTFEYMQALRRGLDRSKGKSPRARSRAIDLELQSIAA